MAFAWISLWLNDKSQPTRKRVRKRYTPSRCRPRVEELESRVVLSDYYLVRGSANTQTSILFHYNSNGGTTFHDEIGVYVLNPDTTANPAAGDNGTVSGTLPNTTGTYSTAVLAEAQPIFTPNSPIGTNYTASFAGGTLLGFYIVQNGTTANANSAASPTATSPLGNQNDGLGTTGLVSFFSFKGANPDKIQHTSSVLYGDGSALIEMNDVTGGGTQGFNAAQFTVSVAGGSGDSLTGLPGQTVPVTFSLTGRGNNTDELGVFSVDAPNGRIGSLLPGQAGYVNAALTSANQHVIFTGSQGAGATTTVNLPGGGLFGLYLVQNDTTADLLAKNGSDQSGQTPVVFFSFVGASPDQFQHLRWTDTSNFTWDDQTGGGKQIFNALVGTVSLGAPQGMVSPPPPAPPPPPPPPFVFQAPTVRTAIAPVSVMHNAAPTTLDLAANFGDPDIVDGNTTVAMNTSSGTINLTLDDQSAPQTVQNFVDYIVNGAYNSSIFHRLANLTSMSQVSSSLPPQILQGGGFALSQNPTSINPITAGPQIANEFNATNADVPDTIAMAKTASGPNTATNQFFFNLVNNSTTLGGSNNGGFTVFGKLADSTTSTATLSALSQVPTFDESSSGAMATVQSALTNIPLSNFSGGTNDPHFPADTTPSNYAEINTVTVSQKDALTYSVTNNTNSALVTTSFLPNHPEQLQLTFTANMTGVASITVKATNKNGQSVSQTFNVTVS